MKSFNHQRIRFINHSFISSQRGATAVEFAIICPLLFLLLFAMVEFGLYLFNRQVITNACREGARAGIVAQPIRVTNEEIEQIVRNYSEQHLVTFGNNDALTVSLKTPVSTSENITSPDAERCLSFSCELEVRASFNYEFLFLSTIGIGSQQIRGLSVMRME
jgi:Flp pilus assembly protein TadG